MGWVPEGGHVGGVDVIGVVFLRGVGYPATSARPLEGVDGIGSQDRYANGEHAAAGQPTGGTKGSESKKRTPCHQPCLHGIESAIRKRRSQIEKKGGGLPDITPPVRPPGRPDVGKRHTRVRRSATSTPALSRQSAARPAHFPTASRSSVIQIRQIRIFLDRKRNHDTVWRIEQRRPLRPPAVACGTAGNGRTVPDRNRRRRRTGESPDCRVGPTRRRA